jgi:hypothetical protein
VPGGIRKTYRWKCSLRASSLPSSNVFTRSGQRWPAFHTSRHAISSRVVFLRDRLTGYTNNKHAIQALTHVKSAGLISTNGNLKTDFRRLWMSAKLILLKTFPHFTCNCCCQWHKTQWLLCHSPWPDSLPHHKECKLSTSQRSSTWERMLPRTWRTAKTHGGTTRMSTLALRAATPRGTAGDTDVSE